MRVAIFINNISNNGGTEVVSKEYAFRLLAESNEVCFISMGMDSVPSDLNNKAIEIHSLNVATTTSVLSVSQIEDAVQYVKEKQIQRAVFVLNVPHKYSPISNLNLLLRVAEQAQTEVVFHNSPKSYIKRYWLDNYGILRNLARKLKMMVIFAPAAKKFIRTIDKSGIKIFTLSKGTKCEMKKYFGVDSEIRYNTYSFQDQALPIKKNIVTFCGRLAVEKNVSLLLNAWSIIDTTGWTLRVIGNGKLREALENFCKKESLENVEFLGNVEHYKIYELMAESKITCLPSFNEGFPTVIVEAMNMVNVILTTRFDGISDELLDAENSIITGYTVKEYSKALEFLLKNDSLVTKMGNCAREKCKAFYDSKQYLEAV